MKAQIRPRLLLTLFLLVPVFGFTDVAVAKVPHPPKVTEMILPAPLEEVAALIERGLDGRIFEIRLNTEGPAPVYDAVAVVDGDIHIARYNGKTLVAITGVDVPEWAKKYDNPNLIKDVETQVKISLTDAIKKARMLKRGEPIFANFARSRTGTIVAYNVELDRGQGKDERVVFDATTGNIIANPDALDEWPVATR